MMRERRKRRICEETEGRGGGRGEGKEGMKERRKKRI